MFKKVGWKRFLVVGGIAAILVVFLVLALQTTAVPSLHERAKANVSEARFFMRQAQTQDLRVQFFSGIREQNYAMDGVTDANTVPFALINVEPRGINLIDVQELTGSIKLGDAEPKEITLERNQFGRNFGFDLGELVDAETEVIFILDEEVFALTQSMPENAISWERALELGVDHFKGELSADGVTSFESYIKIITDRENLGAFWFVQFVTNDGQTLFIVINVDGQLLQGRD